MRATTHQPLTCSSCEGEIVGPAEFHVGLAFCCAGCVVGGPCTCSYDLTDGDTAPARVAAETTIEDRVAIAV